MPKIYHSIAKFPTQSATRLTGADWATCAKTYSKLTRRLGKRALSAGIGDGMHWAANLTTSDSDFLEIYQLHGKKNSRIPNEDNHNHCLKRGFNHL